MIYFSLFFSITLLICTAQTRWRTITTSSWRINSENNVSDENVTRIQSFLDKAKKLFQVEWGLRQTKVVTVCVYNSTASFQKQTHQPWFTAAVWYRSALHIQNPSILSKRNSIEQTIIHEMAHIVLQSRWGQKLPAWFEEGFAVFSSNELQSLSLPKKEIHSLTKLNQERMQVKNISTLQQWYAKVGALIFIIIHQYGKDKLKKILAEGSTDSFEKSIAAFLNIRYSQFEKSLIEEFNFRVRKRKFSY